MMKCKNCEKDFKSKRKTQLYCSRNCQLAGMRKGVRKDNSAQEGAAQETVAQEKVGVPNPIKAGYVLANSKVIPTGALSYEIVEGEKVYGRQAVKYSQKEAWDTRPEPDSPTDLPKPLNRGKYIRQDGSEYQIDATGTTHNVSTKVSTVRPEESIANYGKDDCQCRHCRNNRKNGSKKVINHGPYKKWQYLAPNELNRVSLPGDPDYEGVWV